jgi:2-phospho-L-lactate guanylyltransferase
MVPVVAIVPVGRLEGAKSRLGVALDAEERRDLATDLLTRTLRALAATPRVTDTYVVTPDDEVRHLALAAGARPLRQRTGGLNEGIRGARDEAMAAGAAAILIVPMDLPAISPATLAPLLEAFAAAGSPLVAIVGDRHGRGTNALLLAPPDAIEPQFGGDSYAAHTSAAAAARVPLVELGGPLALDLDTPEDLLLVEAADPERARG